MSKRASILAHTPLRLETGVQPAKRRSLKKSLRRRAVRYSLLAGNLLLLVLVGLLVGKSSDTGSGLQTGPAVANAVSPSDQNASDPLDQLSSADIAVNVARIANLPEERAVTNQADSENAQLAVTQTSGGLVSKPLVVPSDFKSNKDIKEYVAAAGETAASIAAKFHVTTDSILWSNNLASDSIAAGQKLLIPPVNGIVYVVKAGDTPDSLAQKYRASKDGIIAYNDAEINGLTVGSRIIIPDGQIVKTVVATAPSYQSGGGAGFPWGGGPIYNGSNGYDYGYCTWYVASRIAVPSNWGNANTWDNLAPLSGWTVSTVPSVGAIAQTDRGAEGHVAVVTAVSPDGSQIKYSDMNGLAGWGRVGNSDWTPVSRFEHYITH